MKFKYMEIAKCLPCVMNGGRFVEPLDWLAI